MQGAQSQQLALSASNKQFEQNRDRLIEQLQTAEKERQDAQSQLQEQKTTFEEELASLHTLASRHKEERLALEHDKQALAGLVQELTRKAEVSFGKLSCLHCLLCNEQGSILVQCGCPAACWLWNIWLPYWSEAYKCIFPCALKRFYDLVRCAGLTRS